MGTRFAVLLRHYRGAASLTQEHLAFEARLGVRTIQDLESGAHGAPQADTLHRLAAALRLSGANLAAFLEAARLGRRSLGDAPPAAASDGSSFLQVPLAHLVGREDELATVVGLLRTRSARLVTLTGPGGVGKTRLAVAAAAAADRFADGVAYIALAPVRDPRLVVPTIARGLGVQVDGSRSPVATLATALRGREILIVLDNLEHVVAAWPDLADLLTLCSRLTALVTSRIALRLRGERAVPVQPLARPGRETQPDPEALLAFPAVRLFVERVQDARPEFALTETNAAAVAEICRRVDGLPLALELAAARLRVLTPQTLLPRLVGSLDALADGPRDLPPHQQTLRRTMAWSYDLLTPAEQRLFRRLAVFVGGCTLAAVGPVVVVPSPELTLELDELGGLESLMAQSLLLRHEDRDGEPRISMLETIRTYAREQLGAGPEAQTVEQAHAEYFLRLPSDQDLQHGPRPPQWIDMVEQEVDNFRAALQWLEEHGRYGDALRLAARLAPVWSNRGYVVEGSAALNRLLGRPENAAPSRVRAFCLWYAGLFARYQGDLDRARCLAERSLAAAEAVGDQVGAAYAMLDLGWAADEAGERAAARAHYDAALASFQGLGYDTGISLALDRLARLNHRLGDVTTAFRLQRRSLAIRRRINHLWGIGSSLVHLGELTAECGDSGTALACFRECLAAVHPLGTRVLLTAALEGTAAVAAATGEAEHALRLLGTAAALREASGASSDPEARCRTQLIRKRAASALSPEAAARAEKEGRRLTLEEAVALALAAPAAA